MPVGTIKRQDNTRYDLETAPPDGFVTLRRLTYGETQERSSVVAKYTTAARVNRAEARRLRRSGQTASAPVGEQQLQLELKALRLFEFDRCVMDHNLTDENGVKLDFSSPMILEIIDPKVAEEIADYIAEVNDDEVEDPGNVQSGSTTSSAAPLAQVLGE